ncbi:MAG: hypothetical protein GX895_03600 [Clostridiales bacterium]|uniref:DUF6106 family protein n=1 Tax=Clostridium sp. N3C TaxID=1776758 RepID=UPI00092DF2F1|nr:DUF6106 family protein [Clostridium sp. N3C]NLZ47864.1 hypothetical protein [Clostridiales bacterium]SCN24334.1 hypothetical protein N3C_1779 [Clostridium sp. N3C]
MDNYYEQLVTSKETPKYIVSRIGMIVATITAVFYLLINQLVFFLIFALIAIILFFIKKRSYVEYEYTITNGDIDVDIIYEQKKRKRVFNFNVKDVELLAPVDSDEIKNFSGIQGKVVKFYPSTSNDRIYAAMLNKGGKKFKVLFVPNEKFIGLCFKHNPKAVKKNL